MPKRVPKYKCPICDNLASAYQWNKANNTSGMIFPIGEYDKAIGKMTNEFYMYECPSCKTKIDSEHRPIVKVDENNV
jgi:endogenous inhibitor of DNA gyrase (YacG/DUF329 family)